MFLVSRKFHPSFGISGTEVTGTASQQMAQGRRGWEWYVFQSSSLIPKGLAFLPFFAFPENLVWGESRTKTH